MGIYYDYHLHSSFSADSDTPADNQIKQAIALGLKGICFTEHMDPDFPIYDDPPFLIDFESYFSKMRSLKSIYSDRLQIGTGMEFGIQPHLVDTLADLSEKYPFDFIIASQHILDGKDPYYPSFFEGRSEKECYQQFFIDQYNNLKLLSLSSFDTVGHLDYIVRYGPNKNTFYSYKIYGEFIDPILKYLIENGKCLEVNSGGLKYGLGVPNPSAEILRRYKELGGELLTVGSDAHDPRYIAYEFDKLSSLLKEIGFRHHMVFYHRKGTPELL